MAFDMPDGLARGADELAESLAHLLGVFLGDFLKFGGKFKKRRVACGHERLLLAKSDLLVD
ncbi:MAG: hypothetical protein AB7T86_15865 [Xanthobacteraceae bacterium]|uniref:hypothetical protein n=1 Tax=Pseudolabrys sp. TaxID=1960880 RepID=UPI003D14E660